MAKRQISLNINGLSKFPQVKSDVTTPASFNMAGKYSWAQPMGT